jgi:murein DD-endopeptidase MepM/ murein hydrolase activator NlpD
MRSVNVCAFWGQRKKGIKAVMPNSIARRATRSVARSTTALVIAAGFTTAVLSIPGYAADPHKSATHAAPSAPHQSTLPQQLTLSFSDLNDFIAHLRRQGISLKDARSIAQSVQASLTPAQRKTGAVVQLVFGDGPTRSLQSVSIEPPHDGTTAPAAGVATAKSPAAVNAGVLASAGDPPSATVQPISVKPAAPAIADSKGLALIDPFAVDNSSSTRLLPATGATDPEWPSQPPKPQTVTAGGQTLAVVRGKLTTDVRGALRNAGVPERIAMEIAEAVSQHPPLRDVPLTGAHFDVAYQPMPDPSVGFILADFSVNGSHQRIWRYRPQGGVPGFYTDDGARIGGLAMQSPVPGAPIVSPYGMRKHPVLHVNKMHWGVDYKADAGTPVLAAADGTVEDVRRLGNYGLYVRIGHSDGVETTYGHLSRFEKGVRPGDAVKAGDVVGYAGRSGLASGPHLYFEVFVDGKRVNPVPLVSNEPLRLGAADLAIFDRLKRQTTAVQTAFQDQ